MRSIPSIQSFPHKNSHFLVYTQQHTRILFWHAFNFRFAVYFTNTVDSIYIVSYKQCSLILTYSQFQSLQLASHTHSVLLRRSTFDLQSIPPIQSTPSILHSTDSAVWYLHTVSFNHYNLLYTTILVYSCVLFHLDSLVSHKQLPSCLHSSIKEHSVLPMRSIPSIQSFPHKNSQFLVYTQLHTRILFCPCVKFRFAFHSVKYSRLHLYCQLQTVQSDTYIKSVSIITTCYIQPFCSTHAFYSIYTVLFLINSYLLVCTLL